jgi:hypothetical protein
VRPLFFGSIGWVGSAGPLGAAPPLPVGFFWRLMIGLLSKAASRTFSPSIQSVIVSGRYWGAPKTDYDIYYDDIAIDTKRIGALK